MKIKVYTARTEQEAIEKVKNELGMDALILNIKRIQPRGLFSFIRRPSVEVTAAFDDRNAPKIIAKPQPNYLKPFKPTNSIDPNPLKSNNPLKPHGSLEALKPLISEGISEIGQSRTGDGGQAIELPPVDDKDRAIVEQQEKIYQLEEKLSSAQELLDKVVSQLSIAKQSNYAGVRKYENSLVQIMYDSLKSQGVSEKVAEKLLDEANSIQIDDEKNDMSLIIKVVYNTIMNVFGEPDAIDIETISENNPKIVVFLGPTGVGKTTTIAKLSSLFILKHDLRVGMVTADTYRIAAVEQLKTYAEILGIELGIVYNADDLRENLEKMQNNADLIFVDTAGRSHKNSENMNELEQLLDCVPGCERYLVLSTTTKYEDLLNIIGIYKSITDFKLIFTKLDETTCLGTILNVCYLTGKRISYMTFGQNVPDDIELLRPEAITKSLLGLGGAVY